MTEGRIDINGLDLIGFMNLAFRRTRRYTAITLAEVEELNLTEEQYKFVRKAVLDNMNELTRSILRDVLGGDIEGTLIY